MRRTSSSHRIVADRRNDLQVDVRVVRRNSVGKLQDSAPSFTPSPPAAARRSPDETERFPGCNVVRLQEESERPECLANGAVLQRHPLTGAQLEPRHVNGAEIRGGTSRWHSPSRATCSVWTAQRVPERETRVSAGGDELQGALKANQNCRQPESARAPLLGGKGETGPPRRAFAKRTPRDAQAGARILRPNRRVPHQLLQVNPSDTNRPQKEPNKMRRPNWTLHPQATNRRPTTKLHRTRHLVEDFSRARSGRVPSGGSGLGPRRPRWDVPSSGREWITNTRPRTRAPGPGVAPRY